MPHDNPVPNRPSDRVPVNNIPDHAAAKLATEAFQPPVKAIVQPVKVEVKPVIQPAAKPEMPSPAAAPVARVDAGHAQIVQAPKAGDPCPPQAKVDVPAPRHDVPAAPAPKVEPAPQPKVEVPAAPLPKVEPAPHAGGAEKAPCPPEQKVAPVVPKPEPKAPPVEIKPEPKAPPVEHKPEAKAPCPPEQKPPVEHKPEPKPPVEHKPEPKPPVEHKPEPKPPVEHKPEPKAPCPPEQKPPVVHKPEPKPPVEHKPEPKPPCPPEHKPPVVHKPEPKPPVEHKPEPKPPCPPEHKPPVVHKPEPKPPCPPEKPPVKPPCPPERPPVAPPPEKPPVKPPCPPERPPVAPPPDKPPVKPPCPPERPPVVPPPPERPPVVPPPPERPPVVPPPPERPPVVPPPEVRATPVRYSPPAEPIRPNIPEGRVIPGTKTVIETTVEKTVIVPAAGTGAVIEKNDTAQPGTAESQVTVGGGGTQGRANPGDGLVVIRRSGGGEGVIQGQGEPASLQGHGGRGHASDKGVVTGTGRGHAEVQITGGGRGGDKQPGSNSPAAEETRTEQSGKARVEETVQPAAAADGVVAVERSTSQAVVETPPQVIYANKNWAEVTMSKGAAGGSAATVTLGRHLDNQNYVYGQTTRDLANGKQGASSLMYGHTLLEPFNADGTARRGNINVEAGVQLNTGTAVEGSKLPIFGKSGVRLGANGYYSLDKEGKTNVYGGVDYASSPKQADASIGISHTEGKLTMAAGAQVSKVEGYKASHYVTPSLSYRISDNTSLYVGAAISADGKPKNNQGYAGVRFSF